MLEYKPVSYKDINRLISIIEVNKNIDRYLIDKIAESIANMLDSKILDVKIFYFPSNNNNFKDFTYIAVLSSSHVVISSYSTDEGLYLDIDVAWCSGKAVSCKEIIQLLKEAFGNHIKRIITIKTYDYLGNIIDSCDDGFLN